MTWVTIPELEGVGPGLPLGTVVDGVPICVVRVGSEVYAVRDECTHGAVRLSEGEVEGRTIECWMHGSRFDLRSGAALNPPATRPVRTYPARDLGGMVQVLLE